MASKFKDRGQNDLYELFRRSPPADNVRGGLACAYRRGLSGEIAGAHIDPTSLAFAAWEAGKVTAREGQREDA